MLPLLLAETGSTTVTATVISAITAVFTAVMSWIITAIQSVVAVFWTGEALTFLGVLALIALGISIFFLLVGLIQNFLHLRG